MIQPRTGTLPVRQIIRPTTLIEAPRLSSHLGVELLIASETFQLTGSFKFRAAYNVAASVPHSRIIAASSGNFGQAMARACQLLGKSCIIVMPRSSARVKLEAVREYGGAIDLIDVQTKSRSARVLELAQEHPDAYVASAYDDPLVIEGNATLGTELAALDRKIDCIIAPVGGGGLTSGIIQGLRRAGKNISVIGAEPSLANDAARSLKAGQILANDSEPQTIADGVRTLSLGKHNWAILRDGFSGIVEISEEQIKTAVRLLFAMANLKAEPTGALSIAALLAQPDIFRNHAVCCVISGGNVDTDLFRAILAGRDL